MQKSIITHATAVSQRKRKAHGRMILSRQTDIAMFSSMPSGMFTMQANHSSGWAANNALINEAGIKK